MTKPAATRDLFLRYPGSWVSALELERVGGRLSWRTRVSDCRTIFGMPIDNRQRYVLGVKCSEYRYVPRVDEQPSAVRGENEAIYP